MNDTIAKVKLLESEADEETKAKLRAGLVSINEAVNEVKKQMCGAVLPHAMANK